MTVVEFFFDIISPYSRLQYELLMRKVPHWKSMQLKLTPVSIRAIFEGSSNPSPALNPVKRAYLLRDLEMVHQYHDIPFAIPNDFMKIAIEIGSLKLQHFLAAIQSEIDDETFKRLVGEKFFDPNNPINVFLEDQFKQVAIDMKIDRNLIEKILSRLDSEEIKAKLEENNRIALNLGGFGLPITLVHCDPPQWVFGSDRMHLLAHLLHESI
ncbi:glutathione S transferase-like protein 3 [Sarcoptes scabiei]|uniref:Glutathione S-transferase kappa n=1 Tax=Sarcoptes scabiei TaxID=52283 RepID=A0A131ZWQ3_SARSC|nr:glutathione S transferase-like protein 3 [Sarcoptes scabiei]